MTFETHWPNGYKLELQTEMFIDGPLRESYTFTYSNYDFDIQLFICYIMFNLLVATFNYYLNENPFYMNG